MTTLKMDGSLLKQFRERAKATQVEMAAAMGVPLRTYEDLESNRSAVRPIHVHAAEMAVLSLAHQRQDASIIHKPLRGFVLEMAKLIESEKTA